MSRAGNVVESVRARLADSDYSDRSLIVGTMLAIYVLYLLVGFSLGFDVNGQVNALQRITFLTAVFAMAGLALNLHWGYTGLFNVGIAGFMAVGVYAMGMATAPQNPETTTAVPGLGLPIPVGILIGILAAALAGLIVALPALRLRADYLAIVTLGLSEIVRLSFSSNTLGEFTIAGTTMGTGGNSGINLVGDPSKIVRQFYETGFGIGPLSDLSGAILDSFASVGIEQIVVINLSYTVVVVGILGFVYVLVQRLGNSPFGRSLKAIKEDEETTQSLGKNTQLLKAKSFVIGCGLLGLAAILWQGSRGLTTPDTYMIELTVFIWVVVIIGGAGSNTGTVLGAALFVSILDEGPRFFRDIVNATFDVPRAPTSIVEAVGSIGEGDLMPLLAYVFGELAALQFVLLGVVLILIIKRRPEGLMGHRKEPASTLDISRPATERGDGAPGPPAGSSDPEAGTGEKEDATDE